MIYILLYTCIAIAVYALLALGVHKWHESLKSTKTNMEAAHHGNNNKDNSVYDDIYSAKEYVGEEHEWKTTFNLEHKGLKVLNIPFQPIETEVFYIEGEYDVAANKFVKDNIDYIRSRFNERGFTFVYLPDISVPSQLMESTIRYRTPKGDASPIELPVQSKGLPSNYLLDYLIHPENRSMITPGFAWYGKKWVFEPNKIIWYQFDYIAFDTEEITSNLDAVFNDILNEIGHTRLFKCGYYSIEEHKPENYADEHFDEETKNILEEVQRKLDEIRVKGISEAVIAQYVSPRPTLSHIRITKDLRIIMDDYNQMEIKMEPLNKAVFLLFLRHEGGISFKELVDHQAELEIIYRAVKSKNNDIDLKMKDRLFTPTISLSVRKLTNPLDNSINEKCTRIKEAFLSHFHDSIAQNYYIGRVSPYNKGVLLPRNLIIWEE